MGITPGINRVWVTWEGDTLHREINGVVQLFPEWQDSGSKRMRVVAVGPYDPSPPDRTVSKHTRFARSRALRKADMADPGWDAGDLLHLEGAEVVVSFTALVDWLRKGEGGTEAEPHTRLQRMAGMAVQLNHIRAWRPADGRWRGVPSERLVHIQEPGVAWDVSNSVYLLFEGEPLPLDKAGLDPELEALFTVADYQIRATLEP